MCLIIGTFRLILKNGRLEKLVTDAHRGAITCLRWNFEGSSLVTAGEDGIVKQWSRTGNLRSKLAQSGISSEVFSSLLLFVAAADQPVYSVVWSPDNQSILFSSGCTTHFKSGCDF